MLSLVCTLGSTIVPSTNPHTHVHMHAQRQMNVEKKSGSGELKRISRKHFGMNEAKVGMAGPKTDAIFVQ